MCNAFSCIIGRDKKVTWKMGIDSHETLIKKARYQDNTLDPDLIQFCRVEISPKNKNYLEPDEWVFKIDMDITPAWWTLDHKKTCEKAHKKWVKKLDKILVRKPIIHPFKIKPPEITDEHIALLKEWDSVMASVWDSVMASVWDSVWASVRDSVRDSVWDSVMASVWDSVGASVRASVRDSVGASVWASVWAYYGSFFNLSRKDWKYTENIKTDQYPFLSVVKLWERGLVPSFDGKKWRLHGGKDAAILWEGEL